MNSTHKKVRSGTDVALTLEYRSPIMATAHGAFKFGDLIDKIDLIREELLIIQRSLEKHEEEKPEQSDDPDTESETF